MPLWRVREFQQADLDTVVRIWDRPPAAGAEAVHALSELLGAVRAGEPTVVAVVGETVVGAAVATVAGELAWVLRLGLAEEWRHRGIGSLLLAELERRCASAGARRLRCVLADGQELGAEALEHRGFRAQPGCVVFDKHTGHTGADQGILAELGARQMAAGLWDAVGGMVKEKGIIERQVILPLAHPEEAERSGLVPPHAIVLFGPPGTGKTTFAKGIAGRLGWPFVELFPSRLGTTAAGQAAALRDTFALVDELDEVVLFIDEVEEVASRRDGEQLSPAHGLTNEMLKLIPHFREREHRLLVCATNSVRGLDPALLRHGRFDYVIPVGTPDAQARAAIWEHYLASIPHDGVDLDAVVAASEVFTPADIEFAARRAAQGVFERTVLDGQDGGVSTEQVLAAVRETRPTLTPEMVADFEQDIGAHARL